MANRYQYPSLVWESGSSLPLFRLPSSNLSLVIRAKILFTACHIASFLWLENALNMSLSPCLYSQSEPHEFSPAG